MRKRKHLGQSFMWIVLFSFLCCVSIAAQEQRATVNLKNATLRDVISTIEKQTTYRFSYRNVVLDENRNITISLKKAKVSTILDVAFIGRSLEYSIVSEKSIVISDKQKTTPKAGNNKRKITGTVHDEKGEPIIGANVVERGTTNGIITDIDGNFSLTVPDEATLVISYIGYNTQEIKTSGKSSINVKLLENTQNIEEVVVIGYGTARKVDLTGSTSSLDGDRIKQTSSPTLSRQLQGQMAGVQVSRSTGDPSASATIRIRGITTMSDNDPLVIVDGVPGSINDVSSDDVKDIQVLKDAASAAIYGSRAAAGVILITTKRANSKDFAMSYNLEYGTDVATTKPKSANAVEWMTGFNEMRYNDGATSMFSGYSEDFINNYNANHISDPDSYPDVDWMSYLNKSAHHQRHTFSLSGGTDKLRTNFSLNYYKSDALIDVKDYQKFNIRSSNDYNINNWIHAAADINLIYSKSITPHNGIWSYMYENSLMPAIWSDGEYADGKDGDNPYAVTNLSGQNDGRGYTVHGKLQLDLTPIKNLTFTAVAAPNYYFYKGKDHSKKYKVRRINGDYIYSQNFASTSVTEARNDNHSLTMQFYGNYKLQLNRHAISAMAGYEDYSYNWENESAWRSNYTLDNYPYLNLGPADYQYNSGNAGHNAYRSVFGRLMYSWADRYMLQANIRSDGSSRFAKGHRWATFPSFSAGWVISEEPWFKKFNKINYLKLRASYGQLGNERIGSEFPYQALLNFGTGYIPNASTGTSDIVQTAYQSDYAFNNITWETTTTYGVGIDTKLLRNRLRFTGDWYYKKTKNMLLTVGFPSYFGYNAPQNNAADMNTKGWDIEIAWNDQINDFRYGASFNLSDYRSRMGYMADKQSISSNKITEKGSYYQEWYMYKSNGIILNDAAMYDSDGNKIPVLTNNDKAGCIQYVDANGDGKITASGDRVRLGNSLPEMQYGGSLWAEWKNFDFNLSFQGIGHQNVYWSWVSTPFEYQTYSCPKVLIDSHWSPSNTDEQNAKAKYPKLTTGNITNVYAASDFYLFNGAYMRIKNITLGYTIPKSITEKFFVNKLRLYFAANDLPTLFDNYPKGYDPEWDRSGDFIMSSYIFGLNVTF